MRLVNTIAKIIDDKCTGCKICAQVCPTLAIRMEPLNGHPYKKLAVLDAEYCTGCTACEQRCPFDAIQMEYLDEPYTIGVDVDEVDPDAVHELCAKARFHPEQVVCYCTGTRAEEVAAAILKGAKTPDDISRATGLRTGCTVECLQPAMRLLRAAGIEPSPQKGFYQWYGSTPTIWDIPDEVKAKYASRGFYFDDDIEFLQSIQKKMTEPKQEEEIK
ncbi:4Fe-4S binding protein [Alicyclobacillus mali]|uniref:4Fe-4S binding protein n=1 Tax=Alicyclobacillus mali (ex Roth et al. 2021) TaxID=1123961 RepID=A0ABS0F307_9BACL|nr:4Fe-4S binding protein [Alicyclobacillus mali (ex Roth et al. 2021)]MBF8377639.1 4Fe-4S binding protein [Alicyclobacillus mali (ex Roth et al. 2021)]MCL6487825.1 4Fe-4S binding protein [Alicyclobacillus mali (ex Roth et al. 2021)]